MNQIAMNIFAIGSGIVLVAGLAWFYRNVSQEVKAIKNNVEQTLAEDEVLHNEL